MKPTLCASLHVTTCKQLPAASSNLKTVSFQWFPGFPIHSRMYSRCILDIPAILTYSHMFSPLNSLAYTVNSAKLRLHELLLPWVGAAGEEELHLRLTQGLDEQSTG